MSALCFRIQSLNEVHTLFEFLKIMHTGRATILFGFNDFFTWEAGKFCSACRYEFIFAFVPTVVVDPYAVPSFLKVVQPDATSTPSVVHQTAPLAFLDGRRHAFKIYNCIRTTIYVTVRLASLLLVFKEYKIKIEKFKPVSGHGEIAPKRNKI